MNGVRSKAIGFSLRVLFEAAGVDVAQVRPFPSAIARRYAVNPGLDSRALTTKTGLAETVANPCTRV
jgi:hypothetical protein